MDDNKTNRQIKIGAAILGGVIVVFVVYKIYKSISGAVDAIGNTVSETGADFNIGTSKEEAGLKLMKCLQPTFYKTQNAGAKDLITRSGAQGISQKIYDAVTLGIYSNDDAIITQFKRLRNQVQVSFVSESFTQMFGKDLLDYFYSPMTNAKLGELYNFLKALPVK